MESFINKEWDWKKVKKNKDKKPDFKYKPDKPGKPKTIFEYRELYDSYVTTIGIVGSREFVAGSKIRKLIYDSIKNLGKENIVIVSGGQKEGADGMAKKYAIEFGVTYREFPPAHYSHNDYCIKEKYYYGKPYCVGNYHIRNTEIAEYSDVVVCFLPTGWDITQSKGTNDTYIKATKLGKIVKIIN